MLKSKVVIIIFLLLPLLSYSADYTVGTEDIQYYPHYGKFNDENSSFSGYAKDIFDQFTQHEALSFGYKFYPIKRLYKAFQLDGSIDFKYPDNPAWGPAFKTTKNIYYSTPIGNFIDGTVVLKKNKHFTLKNIKKIGTIKGFTPQAYLEKIKETDIRLFEFTNPEKLLKALSHRRVDAIYINIDVINHQRKIHNVPTVFIKTLPYQKGNYHFSTIKHPDLIQKLNAFLENNAMLIQRLKEKYQLSTL